MEVPQTRYARSGELSIAYQVVGDGPFDLVLVPPLFSNVELAWEFPPRAHLNTELAKFSRLVIFDKRGTGLSDRVDRLPNLEERVDDVRAVLDTIGSSRAALLSIHDGASMACLAAASHPDRIFALVLCEPYARTLWAPDYPWGASVQDAEAAVHRSQTSWGSLEYTDAVLDFLLEGAKASEELRQSMARFHRGSASPKSAAEILRVYYETDVRAVLPSIQVPTLVVYRHSQTVEHARYVAEHIAGARLEELPGQGAALFGDDLTAAALAIVRTFLDGAVQGNRVVESDRVLATVLFTDLVDSTTKAVELGDARWRELVVAHHARVRQELVKHRGRELDTAGDGFFASFDGPARAIRCACAIRDSVGELGLDVRAGLHTGECEQLDGKVGGVAVITGARVAAKAAANEVLVTATVRELVAGSGISFEDRGVHALKGLPEERQLYAVVATE